jgi:hypothetical protein
MIPFWTPRRKCDVQSGIGSRRGPARGGRFHRLLWKINDFPKRMATPHGVSAQVYKKRF